MILNGNSLDVLKTLDSETVDCCITSPPYYALRDYKTEGQIGLEKTFQEYLDKLIQVFNEVKRVLKKEGTCWVVMGDTYGRGSRASKCKNTFHKTELGRAIDNPLTYNDKCLLMIPSRFAIQMIDNGWILRNDIIWHKPNCMPSSAKDRFTVDYEHVFFFTKSKKYYFKTQYEPHSRDWKDDIPHWKNGTAKYLQVGNKNGFLNDPNPLGRIKRTVWKIPPKPFAEAHFAVFPEELVKQCIEPGCPPSGTVLDPFMGAGTVPLVALKTNKQFIGIEINPDYIKIANKRLEPYLLQTVLT